MTGMFQTFRNARSATVWSFGTLLMVAGAWSFCGTSVASMAETAAPRPVALGKGGTKHSRWAATVVRDGGRSGGKRPCLGINTIEIVSNSFHGPFESHTSVCSALAPREAPNVVSASLGGDTPEATVFVIGAASSVVQVQIDLKKMGHRVVNLAQLNSQQARNAQVRGGSYGVLVVKGRSCIHQITGVNSNGEVVYKGTEESCAG